MFIIQYNENMSVVVYKMDNYYMPSSVQLVRSLNSLNQLTVGRYYLVRRVSDFKDKK